MNLQELDRLLEKFYSGKSSPDEEDKIIDILCQDDIPEKYRPDRDIFLVIGHGKEIPEPSGNMDFHLRKRLDLEERSILWHRRSRKLYLAIAVAASLLIAFSTYLIVKSDSGVSLTLAETEMVTQKVFTTINTVSSGLHEGKNAMSAIAHITMAEKQLSVLPVTGATVRENLSALDYFNLTLNELIVADEKGKDEYYKPE